MDSAGEKASLYAVFGKPISHSLSPLIHNEAFSARHFFAHYFPVECEPGQLEEKLHAFHILGGRGVNLTRPLKEAILPLAEPKDLWVNLAGAANTLVAGDVGWEAANTDCEALFRLLPAGKTSGQDALILGSGGVARATAAVLCQKGFQVVMAARTPRPCPGVCEVISWGKRLDPHPWQVVVNATPLGQMGEGNEELWPCPVSSGVAVDWVYRPNNTPFIVGARKKGAFTIDGLTLFLEQAALAWLVWFGEEGPRGVMKDVAAPWR